MLIVCDIDGTISDCRHRQHLAVGRDWDAFHSLADLDPPIGAVVWFLEEMRTTGHTIIFLTGRPEYLRTLTLKWLESACDFSLNEDYVELLMRPKDEFRPDYVIKPELLAKSLCDGEFGRYVRNRHGATFDVMKPQGWLSSNVLLLDDRDRVVEMWRNLGYDCWQTSMGAF